jgi:hypothetical protein
MNQYIINEEGVADLDKYFMACKDDIIRIAWKNLKDKYIHPYQSERDKVLDEILSYLLDEKNIKIREKDGERYLVISDNLSVGKLLLYFKELRQQAGEP